MVAIKDMEMPRWCGECGMLREETINGNTSTYCELLNQDITWNGNRVDDCPLVKIEERKVGKWIFHEKSISTAFKELRECSCCHCYFRWEMPRNSYCPNCGAEMRGSENG